MLKKILFIILALIFNFHIMAEEIENIDKKIEEEKPLCRSFVLGDTEGNIFYAKNEKEMLPLASVTKIMTLLLTYDAINEGKIKLSDKVVVDKEMVEMGGSRIWMKEGTKISIDDLIKATAIHSANNAAYGLAKAVGGDIDTFVAMMNKKAKELGFGDEISYNTPTGLPPHMTGRGKDTGSALGIYKLSLVALKYPEYIKVASKKEDILFYSGKSKIYNRNKLLGKEGIYGIKTGHLDNWYNISVASKKDKLNSIIVVLGALTEERRDKKIIEEINLFQKEYKNIEFLNKFIPVDEIDVLDGAVKKVELYPNKNYSYTVKENSDVKFIINKEKAIKAPLISGQKIGDYKLYINDNLVDTGDIVVRDNVEKLKNFFNLW